MNDLVLVHFSDLHFGSRAQGLAPADAFRRAVEACTPYINGAPSVLAISGDVSNRGAQNGYVEARRSLGQASAMFPPASIIMCPGNHDIVSGSFDAFNRFAFEVTNDPHQKWTERTPVATVMRHGYRFVLVNSYFKRDHSRGSIPLEHLRGALAAHAGDPTIVLVHDSPISSSYGGQSLIDGYDFLDLVSRAGAVAAVHGHVHSDQALLIGTKPTLVSGAGSLAFPPDPNMNNHFSVYKFRSARASEGYSFRYHANRGAFLPTKMESIGA